MPDKKPTDAKVVKALMQYEIAFNTLLASVKASESPYKVLDENSLYEGMVVARKYAVEAQGRIDAKNLSKEDK